MPTKMTFDTKSPKQGWDSFEHSLVMPSSIDDVDLIEQRYGSIERLIDRANAQFKVDVQRGMRSQDTPAKAAAFADSFCDNGRKGASKMVVIDTQADDAPEFTPEQLAYIASQGAVTR